MYSLSIVTLGTPRYVIYIAESIDQHDVRVSSLVHHVADRIEEQFEYKFCMSWQMNDSYYEITAHIDASNYEYQSTFSWCKNIRDAVNIPNLEIDHNNIVDDQTHQQKGIEREYVRYVMCIFGPLSAKQTPSDTQNNHENVNKRQYLGCILNDIAGARLDDCRIEGKQVKSRNEIPIDKRKQSEEHWDRQQHILPHEIMARLHCIVIVISEDIQEREIRRVDPSSTLNHQLLVTFHGICVGYSVRYVLQIESPILLAVYT